MHELDASAGFGFFKKKLKKIGTLSNEDGKANDGKEQ